MKKLLTLCIFIAFFAIFLCSCSEANDTFYVKSFERQELIINRFKVLDGSFVPDNNGGSFPMTIVVIEDNETGILYLYLENGYRSGLTPWLKSDGTYYKISDIEQ
jgi:hypothetical protein